MADDDDMFGEGDGEDEIAHSYSWTKEHAVLDLLGYAAAMQQVTAEYMAQVAYRAAADSNKMVDKRVMHEEAALEIERLTLPTEGE